MEKHVLFAAMVILLLGFVSTSFRDSAELTNAERHIGHAAKSIYQDDSPANICGCPLVAKKGEFVIDECALAFGDKDSEEHCSDATCYLATLDGKKLKIVDSGKCEKSVNDCYCTVDENNPNKCKPRADGYCSVLGLKPICRDPAGSTFGTCVEGDHEKLCSNDDCRTTYSGEKGFTFLYNKEPCPESSTACNKEKCVAVYNWEYTDQFGWKKIEKRTASGFCPFK